MKWEQARRGRRVHEDWASWVTRPPAGIIEAVMVPIHPTFKRYITPAWSPYYV